MLSLQIQVPSDDPKGLTRYNSPGKPESQGDLARLPHGIDRAPSEPLETFFQACGGTQTISLAVRRVEGRGNAEAYAFQQPFVVIGSCPDSDLVMPDRSVNYRHIYLQLVAGRWFFANLARISRTKAGQGNPASGPFDVGCELKVGYHFIKRVGPAPAELIRQSADDLPESSVDLPSFTLHVVGRRQSSSDLPPTEFSAPVTLIGTSKHCDLVLDDESISRVHASLVLTTGGLWAVDLLGRGGLIVDGRREIWSQVHDGSVLQIGRASIRVRIGAARTRPIGRLGRRAAPLITPSDSPAATPPAVSYGGLSEGAVLSLMGQLAEMQNQFFEHSRMQMQWMSQMLAQVSQSQQDAALRDMARIEEISCELREIRAQLARTPVAKPVATPVSKSDAEIRVGGRSSGNVLERLLQEADESEAHVQQAPQAPSAGRKEASPIQNSLEAGGSLPAHTAAFEAVTPPQTEKEANIELPVAPAAEPKPYVQPKPAADAAPAQANPAPANPAPAPQSPTSDKKTKPAQPPPAVDSQVWLTERMAKLSQEQNSLWARLMSTFSGK